MSAASSLDGLRDRPIFRGAAAAMLISAGSLATGFAVQVSLARLLGHENYGAYAFAFACVNVAAIFCKFDLDTTATRFGGTYSAHGDWPRFRILARSLLQWTLGISVGIVALAGGALALFRSAMLPATLTVLLHALVILPPMALLTVSSGLLQSTGRVVAAQFPNSLLRSLVFLGIIVVLGFWVRLLSAEGAILANSAGTALALGLSLFLLYRGIPRGEAHAAVVATDRAEWFRTAQGALLVNIGQIVLSTQTDVVLLGIFTSKREAGFYSVAAQLSSLALLGVVAIQTVVGPRIAALYASGDLTGLQSLVDKVRRGSLLVTLPVLAGLVVGGPWILGVFGPEFVHGSYRPLVILALANLNAPLVGSLGGFLLTLTGHQAVAARIVGISAVAYFALAFVLGPLYGPEGIATTTLVAYLIRAALIYWYAKRRVGIDLLGV